MERIFLDYVLPCLWAFLACVGFTLVFNIHGVGKLICGFGGGLGWLVYLLAGSSIVAAFLAAVAIGVFSEIMARLRRCPVTGYLLVALLPLVPGGGIYYAMSYCVAGDTDRFLAELLHTFGGGSHAGLVCISDGVSSAVPPAGRVLRRGKERESCDWNFWR